MILTIFSPDSSIGKDLRHEIINLFCFIMHQNVVISYYTMNRFSKLQQKPLFLYRAPSAVALDYVAKLELEPYRPGVGGGGRQHEGGGEDGPDCLGSEGAGQLGEGGVEEEPGDGQQ